MSGHPDDGTAAVKLIVISDLGLAGRGRSAGTVVNIIILGVNTWRILEESLKSLKQAP